MSNAKVGDDVFGEDPTVNHLQEYVAQLMGMEAALFVPSGTMGNQLAMLAHCRRGDEVIVGRGAHSFLYESGGGAVLAGVQFQIIGQGGHFTPTELEASINGYDASAHVAPSTLVMIENTHNRGGGKVLTPQAMEALYEVCQAREVHLHIDGARLWNAAIALDTTPRAWARVADSLTFCLSKGLGAPVGSVLCGSRAFIQRAHRYRKMLGGGMRQAGILAAAGLYALENHVEDLRGDHERAKRLARALSGCPGIEIDIDTVETNIVLFTPIEMTPNAFCDALNSSVRVLPFGDGQVRAVLHRDIGDEDLEYAIESMKTFCQHHFG